MINAPAPANDALAARALAADFAANPREASLQDQAVMRIAAQDPLRAARLKSEANVNTDPVDDITLPVLPPTLLNAIGHYGFAQADKATENERLHRWELLIAAIKDYTRVQVRADRASTSRAARDPRDVEAWEALGLLSGLHGCMTIDADQPMKMAQAIFDHVQAELKHWSDEAAKSSAMLVDLAQERGELARWRLALPAAVDVGAAQVSPYDAFAARYKADPADPACADQVATYTDGWDDSRAAQAETAQAAPASTLIDLAREVEALKRPCGMDPESPIAIQNGRYMGISYKLRALAAAAGDKQP